MCIRDRSSVIPGYTPTQKVSDMILSVFDRLPTTRYPSPLLLIPSKQGCLVRFPAKSILDVYKRQTWTDAMRTSSFPQSWTIFYWAYWMVWCVATPFFIGTISKGRTIRQTVLGGYFFGLSGTFTSFIILGNYGLGLQMHEMCIRDRTSNARWSPFRGLQRFFLAAALCPPSMP